MQSVVDIETICKLFHNLHELIIYREWNRYLLQILLFVANKGVVIKYGGGAVEIEGWVMNFQVTSRGKSWKF